LYQETARALERPQSLFQETSMRSLIRIATTILSVGCLAASLAVISANSLLAQNQTPPAAGQAAPAPGQPPPLKQMALTDKQIEGVIAAQKEMNPITDKLPDNAPADPKVIAQLETIAKKHGFASYDEYNVVIDNISLVLGGIDPATKKYIGSEAVIKNQIAQVAADKKMSADEKKEVLDDLKAALKSPEPPIENKGNIDLIVKYYDKLEAVMAEDQN
jgi:hypothetical protein